MSRYRRLFLTNHELLAEMLALRLAGVPYKDLKSHFNLSDGSVAVRHWCQKFNVEPKMATSIRFVTIRHEPNTPTKVFKYQARFDENDACNRGKSYSRYLVESRKNLIKSFQNEYLRTVKHKS